MQNHNLHVQNVDLSGHGGRNGVENSLIAGVRTQFPGSIAGDASTGMSGSMGKMLISNIGGAHMSSVGGVSNVEGLNMGGMNNMNRMGNMTNVNNVNNVNNVVGGLNNMDMNNMDMNNMSMSNMTINEVNNYTNMNSSAGSANLPSQQVQQGQPQQVQGQQVLQLQQAQQQAHQQLQQQAHQQVQQQTHQQVNQQVQTEQQQVQQVQQQKQQNQQKQLQQQTQQAQQQQAQQQMNRLMLSVPLLYSGSNHPVNYSQSLQQQSVGYNNTSTGTLEGHNSGSHNFDHALPQFTNPFFGNSYPITNPPLFDSTMLLPFGDSTGTNRRRRISISNGQIGQIVNHEAFFMDEDLMEEFYEQSRQIRPHSPDSSILGPRDDSARSVQNNHRHLSVTGVPRSEGSNYNNPEEQAQIGLAAAPMTSVKTEHQEPFGNAPAGMGTGIDMSNPGARSIDDSEVAGLPPPNHLLIYNNEIIFNPNNGPIPGTAAWKKERLLERNRVAASKCRQRKKHAHQQLQENMNKAQQQVKEKEDLIEKYRSLLEIYNYALKRHFNGEKGALEPLSQYVETLIEDIKNFVAGSN